MSADLDKAIDRAVREMLDVEPQADLRAKVIARIDARPAASLQFPVASFRRFAALTAGAALLLALTLMLVARRSGPPAQAPVLARGADQVLPTPQPMAPAPHVEGARERVRGPRVGARMANAVSVDEATAAPGIDPLKTIAPIEIAPIAQSSITPEPIGVRPLNPIAEVQVAPLNPPERRD